MVLAPAERGGLLLHRRGLRGAGGGPEGGVLAEELGALAVDAALEVEGELFELVEPRVEDAELLVDLDLGVAELVLELVVEVGVELVLVLHFGDFEVRLLDLLLHLALLACEVGNDGLGLLNLVLEALLELGQLLERSRELALAFCGELEPLLVLLGPRVADRDLLRQFEHRLLVVEVLHLLVVHLGGELENLLVELVCALLGRLTRPGENELLAAQFGELLVDRVTVGREELPTLSGEALEPLLVF